MLAARGCRLVALCLVAIALPCKSEAFDREPWQAPVISEAAGATEIRIEKAPAGLYFRRKLDAAKRYALSVNGSAGPITLRLQLDDRPHEYLAAPVAATTHVISGASKLELLFYADKPAVYRLEQLTLDECLACRTRDDLKARIEREAPDVASSSGLAKAIALLKWASNVADYSPRPELTPRDFESWLVEKMVYEFFDKDLGGVACGGHSVFFRHVLDLFGIDAFTINFGIPNSFATHVTVVVPHGGEFYMLDPSFGVTLAHDRSHLDVAGALRLFRSGNVEAIAVREHGLARRDIIDYRNVKYPALEGICVDRSVTAAGIPKCTIGDNSLLSVFQKNNARYWSERGVALDNAAFVRLMFEGFFSVGPSKNPTHRSRFIELLAKNGIGFHSVQHLAEASE